MNEGVFPRTIREDAFLRDRDREVLETDLGYKVNQKLTGYDEEKLLFTLLVGAARERLYCSYQRADDNGRALAPSWYIEELKQALGGQGCELVTIPRSLIEKAATAPFDRQELLLSDELAIRLTLENQDPTSLIEATGNLPALYQQGRKIVGELDRSGDRLLGYDGLVGELAGYWKHFAERGLSPTALETYARCPFQFFARHVLGLTAARTSRRDSRSLIPPSSASWAMKFSMASTRRSDGWRLFRWQGRSHEYGNHTVRGRQPRLR